MKSIFNPADRKEVVGRIGSLNAGSKALWGKMTVDQMIRHCTRCEEYYFGKMEIKRSMLGRVIGKFAIKGLLKDDSTKLGKNAPTAVTFRVTDHLGDLVTEKAKWQALIEDYGTYGKEHFDHWFFGRMSREQLGQFVYKHCDHHLRQFGC